MTTFSVRRVTHGTAKMTGQWNPQTGTYETREEPAQTAIICAGGQLAGRCQRFCHSG